MIQAQICCYVIALVLGFSSLAKCFSFAKVKEHFLLWPFFNKFSAFWVLALIALEFVLMLSIFMSQCAPWVILLVSLFFMATTISSWWIWKSGKFPNCSCYGTWVKITPWQSFKLNLIYLLFLFYALSEIFLN